MGYQCRRRASARCVIAAWKLACSVEFVVVRLDAGETLGVPEGDDVTGQGQETESEREGVNLLDKDVRRDLQNDLLELSAFLLQRKSEMASLESEGLSSLLSGYVSYRPFGVT